MPAAFALGLVTGATTAAATALLLYAEEGFLGTAGLLLGLALGSLGLGLWVGAESSPERRRWIGAITANVAAALFAAVWSAEPEFRGSTLGGALAALFLLANPGYTAGALFTTITKRSPGSAAPALFGAGLGVALAALLLIPRHQPGVIFVAAAAVLLVVALMETRRPFQQNMKPTISLNGTCAIVTGVGDRGQVGFAVAQTLIAAGARVCITGLKPAVDELASELGALGVMADLTNEDDVARLVHAATSAFGRLDLLVNVAGGLSVIKPIADTTRAEWERETQRNAETAFLVSRAALPALREARGVIVNFASPAALRAVPQLGAYSAAKAAVSAFTRALAIEEKGHGVRVNAIAPGMIDTEQNRASAPENTKWVSREQVANVVLFLASDAGSAVTGETIQVLGEGIE